MKSFIKILALSLLIAFILFVVEIVFRLSSNIDVELNLQLVKVFGYYIMYSIPLTFVNSSFFGYLNERIVWNRYKKYRLAIGFFGSVIITIGTVFLIRIFHRVVLDGVTYNEFLSTETMDFYYTSLIITIVASLFFHAFYFYQELQRNKIKEQKVIAGAASAKFDALKNQLDPTRYLILIFYIFYSYFYL